MEHDCLVTKHDADANDNIYDCVVLHDADTNDNIHDCVALHDANTNDTTSTDTHMSVARIVSSVAQCHIICTRTVAQVMSLLLHPHGHGHLSVSPHLDSPFLFPALPHAPFLLPPAPEVRRQPVHSAQRECGVY